MLGTHGIEYTNMEVSQVFLNGQKFLQDRRPIMLGISPGNPYYYKLETLERLFDFAARKNSDQVSYFHSSSREKCIEEYVGFSLFYCEVF